MDYYQVNRFVPEHLYLKTWLDNHVFMLEKQVYSEDFFLFVKQVMASAKVPADYMNEAQIYNTPFQQLSQQHQHILYNNIPLIYPKYADVLPEMKQLYRSILQFLTKLILDILSHANDNDVY